MTGEPNRRYSRVLAIEARHCGTAAASGGGKPPGQIPDAAQHGNGSGFDRCVLAKRCGRIFEA